MNYILASKSPRRKEILTNLGIPFSVITADTDEKTDLCDPCRMVEELARRKGVAVRNLLLSRGEDLTDTVIISSDTVVEVDGTILGKPHDAPNTRRMLRLLSGRTHRVISGICLIGKDCTGVSHDITEVEFDRLDDGMIEYYLQHEPPFDKAGAYAIQGLASSFITGIRGDYFNVVGLPVHKMYTLYREVFGEKFL